MLGISSVVSVEDEVDGAAGCRCLGSIPSAIPVTSCTHSWAPAGECVTVQDSYGTPSFGNREYPATYGSGCMMHMEPADENCVDAQGNLKPGGSAYCFKPWCYVDPCSCNLEPSYSKAFGGDQMAYSYETCGATDTFTPADEQPAECVEADAGFSDDRDACADPGADSYDWYLAYPSHNKTITVPPVPTELSKYSYATNRALVAVPAKCVTQFGEKYGMMPNFNDRQPGGPTGMHYMRVSNAVAEYAALLEIAQSSCAAGLVLLLHGTSGARWQAVSYVAQTSGAGYLTIMLDSHAMPADMGLKGAGYLKASGEMDTSNYCGSLDAYSDRCGTWAKPFCYSSKYENLVNDRVKSKKYVERNYLIRKMEVDYFVSAQQPLLNAFSKVFLFGRSEGAMVASRYYSPNLHPKLAGIILSGASCEYNYFVSCKENAKLCEGSCSKETPILNFIGDDDSYFGATDSLSTKVAASVNGYGGPITGNCFQSLHEQEFRFGTVVTFGPAGHSIIYSHDNAVRSVVYDFMASPKTPATWKSIQRSGCSYKGGVYNCDGLTMGERPCQAGWGPNNPNASFINYGSPAQHPMTCGDIKATYKAHSCCGNPMKHVEL